MGRVNPIARRFAERIALKKMELAGLMVRVEILQLGINEDEEFLVDTKPKQQRKKKDTKPKKDDKHKTDPVPLGPTIQCKACAKVSEISILKIKTVGEETWKFCPNCDAEIVI